MGSVRINISLPEEIFDELSQEVENRKRSRFITEAIKRTLKDIKEQKLAAEYLEASADIRKINRELEGVISDGLN
jgi:metal-responsive CopG/Arc/MetJ family transcriptional regulator